MSEYVACSGQLTLQSSFGYDPLAQKGGVLEVERDNFDTMHLYFMLSATKIASMSL